MVWCQLPPLPPVLGCVANNAAWVMAHSQGVMDIKAVYQRVLSVSVYQFFPSTVFHPVQHPAGKFGENGQNSGAGCTPSLDKTVGITR